MIQRAHSRKSLAVALLSALTLILAALAGASPRVEGIDDSRLGASLLTAGETLDW